MLKVFSSSSKKKFCEGVSEAYEAILNKYASEHVGEGLVADLIATMLYLTFTYSKGEIIVK